MNNISKVVWSHVHQQFVVVSEIASSVGKAKSTRTSTASASRIAAGAAAFRTQLQHLSLAVACAVLAPAAWAQTPEALPTGGRVVAGQGSIQTQGHAMTVNQGSQRMALDWQSFNIGAGQTVNFVQPNAQAVALNRVLGSDVSTIQGQINANGRVYLLNPNGILFTPSAQVNVGGLVASTLGMTNADFMAGNDRLAGDSTAAVINQGQIRTAQGGTVALVAAKVTNAGDISAPSGAVWMAAGRKVRLDLGGPAQIEVEEGALDALIEQTGSIRAADGMVYLTAKAASQLNGSAINHSGLIEAGSIDAKGGLVTLEADRIHLTGSSRIDATGAKGGGTVLVGGDWQGSGSLRQATTVTMDVGSVIDASATENGNGGKVVLWSDVHNANSVTTASGAIYAKGGSLGGDGGQIETSGATLKTATIQVDASAQVSAGRAGLWLIDPYDYVIDSAAATNIVNALNTGASGTSVEVSTLANAANYGSTGSGTGNITVSSAISADTSKAANLSLVADGSVTLNAPISVGGNVSVTSTGLSGTGGIALASGKSLTVNQSGNSLYAGVVSGAGSFVKDGAGALTLSADHTYTGSTTISAGTLQVGNGAGTGSLATSEVINNGSLKYHVGSNQSVNYVISGAGDVVIKGGESVLFSNNFLTTTPQTVASGTTVLDLLERIAGGTMNGIHVNSVNNVGQPLPAGAYYKKYDAATNSATFQIQSFYDGGAGNQFVKVVFVKLTQSGNNVQASVYQGRDSNFTVYSYGADALGKDFSNTNVAISGSLGLATTNTANGYGVDSLYSSAAVKFLKNNTYTGLTKIENTDTGVVRESLSSGNGFGVYQRITTGVLELGDGASEGSISGTSAVQNNGVLIFNRSDAVSFDKNISGTGNVVKNNANTVTYTGAGTYSGITYVIDGILSVGNAGTTGSLTGNIINKSNVTFNRSDDLTYVGIVSGTGTLTKAGAGDLTMTGNQTYNGATTISAGQLVLSNNAPTTGTSSFAGPGQLVIQPLGDDFSANFSTSGWIFDPTLGGLTIGKAATSANGIGDKDVAVANAIAIAGPIAIYGKDVGITGGLTSTATNGTVTLKVSGTVSDGVNGFVVADNLLLLGGHVQLDHASNNVGTLAASGVDNLSYWNSNALTIGTVDSIHGITATGAVDVATLTGDLTVAQNVSTTNTSTSAVMLNAGKSTAAGTASGGNVVLTGSSTIGAGADSTVKVYTGQLAATGNPNSLVTQAQGRFRYNADETTNFAAAPWTNLGTGKYVVYREQPTAAVTLGGNISMVYGDTMPVITPTGVVNGDVTTVDGVNRQNSSSGHIKVGSYDLTSNLLGLGYAVSGLTGVSLMVTPKSISASGISAQNKTYDGTTVASLTGTASVTALGSDAVSVTGTAVGAFADKNAGVGKVVTVSGLQLTGADAGNYSVLMPGGLTASINKSPLSLAIDAQNKRSGDPDPTWRYQILSGSLLNGDALTLSRPAGEAPGKYLISAANPNYQISAADAYLSIANRMETASVVNGVLTVAPVQPAAQATNSPVLATPSASVSASVRPASVSPAAQVSSGLMMIPVAADQAKAMEFAQAPASESGQGAAQAAAAGLLQSAQSLGYTGVLVVEGGVRLPDGVR